MIFKNYSEKSFIINLLYYSQSGDELGNDENASIKWQKLMYEILIIIIVYY